MRIGIVTPTEIGQSETFIRAHIEKLPHKVVYFHGFGNDYVSGEERIRDTHPKQSHRWLNLFPRILEFRIRRHFCPNPDTSDLAKSFLKREQFDVILAEYGTAAAFVSPLCRALGIPLVAHFHGIDASRRTTLEHFASSYREMFSYASSVISVSDAMSKNLIQAGCPPEKIVKNPYGPNPAFFEVEPNYQSDTIIAVGRHTGKKAPYLTLDAFRRAREKVPSLRLVMIGDGEIFEVSDRLVDAWGLRECVELRGAAEPSAIREAMGEAFIFVQHSIEARNGDSEGTPVAILEAGAAGLPVVSTRHAGIPEVIEHGVNGFLTDSGDSAGMAEQLVRLALDRDLTRRMGTKARQNIRHRYTMKRHLETLDAVLSNAAANAKTGSTRPN